MMQYRKLGKIEKDISTLGFGCMRFPTVEGKISRPESEKMLMAAIEAGVNYLDTAWPYHGKESEPFVGEFVSKNNLRDKLYLATKLPIWEVKAEKDLDEIFNTQLENLKTDHIDFYLLHAINAAVLETIDQFHIIQWAEKKKEEGKIIHFGFSFHGPANDFEKILDVYDKWEFCQIQLNYMDIEHQQGIRGLELAHEKGLGVIIMEPLQGGNLCNPPEKVQAVWDTAESKRSPTDWALQWLWSRKEVGIILSGMSSMEHVMDNVASAERSSIGLLSDDENALISQVRDTYLSLKTIGCTDCKYCLPCPQGVQIPRNFAAYNAGRMYEDMDRAKGGYSWIPENARADKCIACGECLDKCPQSIPIIDELEKIAKQFA